MQQISLISKINSIKDVTKSLQEIEKVVNELIASTNTPAEGVVSDAEGKTGDVRITQNEDKNYIFEIRAEDGWKTPVIGNSAVIFKEKPSPSSKNQKKSIDELDNDDASTGGTEAKKTIFDEKADKFVIARPDYDSGWTANASADAATTLTHNLNTQDFSLLDLRAAQDASGSNTTWVMLGSNTHSNTGKKGYIVQISDDNNIKVGIAQDGVPQFHCAGLSGEGTDFTHFRLRMWK